VRRIGLPGKSDGRWSNDGRWSFDGGWSCCQALWLRLDGKILFLGIWRRGSHSGYDFELAIRHIDVELTALFDLHREGLRRFLLSLGLAPQDAEEVVQETFLALLEHLRADRPRDNLRAWIFQVGHNRALKLRAGQWRWSPELSGEWADGRWNAEEQLVFEEQQRQLQAVFAALAPRDRACLSLRAEGFRYREIASILGISLGSVAQAMERGFARLKAAATSGVRA
jgi:RNA polymerase sigma-70 factor, ECF subfamily